MKSPEVLAVIVARGGSKSIPKKSIALCAGKPLMWYTIDAAKKAKHITRLIISTDDEEMAEVARQHGVEVPFMRPKELAEDHTPDLPVFQHVLNHLRETEGYIPDVVVHLRPTTPLKKAEDIDEGIMLLLNNPEAHSVRSVCAPLHTPFKMYRSVEGTPFLQPILRKEYPEVFEQHKEPFNMPRQALPSVYRHSGYIDIVRPHIILEADSMSGTNIIPLPFEEWRDIDIDYERDLRYAELIIQKQNLDD